MMKLKFKRKTQAGRYPWAVNDREHAEHVARIKIEAKEVLSLDVDFGLYVSQQAFQRRLIERPSVTGMAVSLLFHRAVEMLDAVDALLCAGATLPACAVARSMLEAVVYSRYLSVINDERVAAAFLSVAELDFLERMNAVAERHVPGSGPTIKVREAEEQFRARLADQRIWREAVRELERLRKEEGPATSWFRAFNGPRTISGVINAIETGRPSDDVFGPAFDRWSQTIHCTNWNDSVALDEHSSPEAVSILLRPLRTVRKDTNHFVVECHALFAIGLETVSKYFGGTINGMREWLDLTRKMGMHGSE